MSRPPAGSPRTIAQIRIIGKGGPRGRSPGFCFYGCPAARCLRREAGIHDNVIVGI